MKLLKKIMTVFGGTAGVEEISVFGSLSESATEYTTDPDEIQKLNTYSTGWFNAVFGNGNPTIEDRMALDYLTTYQLSYLFQQGIPEYNVLGEYHIDSYVKVGKIIYRSLINDNIGQPVSNTLAWQDLIGDDVKRRAFKNYPVGETVAGVGSLGIINRKNVNEIKLFGQDPVVAHVVLGNIYSYDKFGDWTSGSIAGTNDCQGIISGDDVGIAISANPTDAKLYAYNDDGTAVWQNPTAVQTGPFVPNDIAFGNGVFIIAEKDSRIFGIASNDPDNYFESYIHAVHNNFLAGVVFDESTGRFIVAGTNPAGLGGSPITAYTEDDGATWTLNLNPAPIPNDLTEDKSRLQIGNGMLLFYCYSPVSGIFIIRSTDSGTSWSVVAGSNDLPFQIDQLDFCNGYFIATATDKRVGLISKDGENWESIIFDSDNTFAPVGQAYSSEHKRIVSIGNGITSMSLKY